MGVPQADAAHQLDHARARLLQLRNQRVSPGLDNKVLTSWNGLTIAALAIAARNLNDNILAAAACDALDQLREHAWRDGQLFAVQANGQSRFPAYLDDYAYLLDAVVEVLQTRWRDQDLQFAIELADTLLKDFADTEHGGFHRETPLQRKPCYDWAICWAIPPILKQLRMYCALHRHHCNTILQRIPAC